MSFRFDRFATLYLVNPLRISSSNRMPSIPILMYHSVSGEDNASEAKREAAAHPYYRTSTSPQRFAEQINYLHGNGYRTVSLADAASGLWRQLPIADKQVAEKQVVVTFDDGYQDFYRHAFPVLSQCGFSATVFLPTSYIRETPTSFKGRDCLTWAEVRELNQHGIRFGSHTVTHPQLRDLSPSAVKDEIFSSKKTIEEKLGGEVDSFAYPYAFPQTDTDFRKMLRDLLLQAGYRNGVCTIVGLARSKSDAFFMERLPVNSCDDDALFQAKLTGAYDWVAKFQYASKMIKACLRGVSLGSKYRVPKDFPAVHGEAGNGPCPPETCSRQPPLVIKETRSSSRS
jgi:peptidoglycan/xylan/chitin deacetylase (PgdA/CDA1 family)